MRKINNTDLFTLMRIMRKTKIKANIVEMSVPKDISEEQYGILLLLTAIENAPDAEKEIFDFLASVGEVDVDKLKQDEFDLLPRIIKHLMDQKHIVDFLSQAYKSTN